MLPPSVPPPFPGRRPARLRSPSGPNTTVAPSFLSARTGPVHGASPVSAAGTLPAARNPLLTRLQVLPMARILLVLSAPLLLTACQGNTPEQRIPPVLTAPLRQASFHDQVDTISTLEAIQEVQLAAQVNGRIDALPIRPGQRVQAGALLLSLDDAQARAEVARLQAETTTNGVNYQRYSALVRQGAATAFQRDQYQQLFISSREQLRASLASLAFRDLRAPFSGTITDLSVKVGDVIQAGVPITRLVRDDRLMARIDVPTTYLPQLRLGLPVTLLDPFSGRPLAQGRLSEIDPSVTVASQSVLVKAAFPGRPGPLRPGLRVRTRLLLDQRRWPAVPFAAVSRQSGQSFVYTVRRSPKGKGWIAQQNPVRLGNLQGGLVPVLAGLPADARVIVSSQVSLRQGLPVRPRSAPAGAAPAHR